MMMPEMDGESLGRSIKEDASLQSAQLVMLTSMGMRGDAARVREIGFATFLTKPVKQSELLNTLITVMSRPGREGQQEEGSNSLITRHSIREQWKSSLRVLVADDNQINRLVAQRFLRKAGYDADVVTDGSEVLDACEQQAYDIILIDCQMPRLDGFAATRVLRGMEGATRHTFIIALTAAVMSQDEAACREAGMDDFLGKPLQFEVLRDTTELWANRIHAGYGAAGVIDAADTTPLALHRDAGPLGAVEIAGAPRSRAEFGASTMRHLRRVNQRFAPLLESIQWAIAHDVPGEAMIASPEMRAIAETTALGTLVDLCLRMEESLAARHLEQAREEMHSLERFCQELHADVESFSGSASQHADG